MENTDNLTFYILRELTEDPTKDFSNFIYDLKDSYNFVDIVQNSPTSVSLSGASTYKSELTYISVDKPEIFNQYAFCCRLNIGREDYLTFGKLRQHLARQKDQYRIYSQQLHCFLPKNTELVSLEFGSVNIKTFSALKKYALLPIYFSQSNHVYYALNLTDKKIHLVNPYLLDFIYDKNIPETKLPELSYPVASSLNLFSAMFDRDLIPINFYEYYGKSTKIINYSYFDINHQDRKVFIKPYIFEFKQDQGRFYTLAGKDGGSLLSMDKIRPGETLDQSLLRVVKDDLKIAPDYLAALVSQHLEFDRDRDGIITPRLIIYLYVDKINDPKWVLQMSQTGWRSPNGDIPKINPNPDFSSDDTIN